jgi:hypothetical protein
MDYIVIPTLGRVHKQITYNNLPESLQNQTLFTVQPHEYDEMHEIYGDKVLKLPKEINRIAATREWIFNEFKDTRHMVFDDDLDFVVKEPNPEKGGTKWISHKFEEQDFFDAIDLITNWMDEGIAFGGLLPAWVIPDLDQWPVRENQRMMTNWFFDGPNIPRDLEWCRVDAAEDFDVNLQLLTRGFKNRVSAKYMVTCSATNADGGCSTWRTLEVHNESQRELAKLWPDFVKIREKEVPSGPWKGQIKLATTIQHKKAYESSQQNSLEDFFG